ncbi:MAG TPA: PilZ domain-containing protein [Polyangiaceae bacterium]|jgi:hypothetical protein|nr:PilZ domain-containing protein [Polyangiaceae bacterium]
MSAPDRDDETPPPDSLTPSERRLGLRHLSCFPAHLERDGDGARAAMIHDLSVSGALLLVRTVLAVGDTVRLRLFITGDTGESRDVVGRIVRIEKLGDPFAGPWSSRVAVQFDEELRGVDGEIAALAKRQAEAT